MVRRAWNAIRREAVPLADRRGIRGRDCPSPPPASGTSAANRPTKRAVHFCLNSKSPAFSIRVRSATSRMPAAPRHPEYLSSRFSAAIQPDPDVSASNGAPQIRRSMCPCRPRLSVSGIGREHGWIAEERNPAWSPLMFGNAGRSYPCGVQELIVIAPLVIRWIDLCVSRRLRGPEATGRSITRRIRRAGREEAIRFPFSIMQRLPCDDLKIIHRSGIQILR